MLRGGRGGNGDEPTSFVTQLVIDSNDGVEIQRRHAISSSRDVVIAKLRGGGVTDTAQAESTSAASTADISDKDGAKSITMGGVGPTASSSGAAASGGAAHFSRYVINGAILTDAQKAASIAYDERQQAALQRALPREFDWQTYLLYHPDLRAVGISTETLAKLHYLKQGRAEGRVYKRLRVILRYTACTGALETAVWLPQYLAHCSSKLCSFRRCPG